MVQVLLHSAPVITPTANTGNKELKSKQYTFSVLASFIWRVQNKHQGSQC